MNIKQAKSLSLMQLLEDLGCKVKRKNQQDIWYLSPVREEKTASFHIHPGKNIWYDHGTGRGGSIIDFAIYILERQGQSSQVSDALKWLENRNLSYLPKLSAQKTENPKPRLKLLDRQPIQNKGLVNYLVNVRGIGLDAARLHLEQALVLNENTDKKFVALSMANEDNGFELRNPFLKSCIAPKSISFIRGRVPKPSGIHVFEGMMDFLSVITRQGDERLEHDSIILHSVSNLSKALPYIQGYGYQMLFSWSHHDKAGEAVLSSLEEFTQNEPGLVHVPMNKIYRPHNDVNDWHLANPVPPTDCKNPAFEI